MNHINRFPPHWTDDRILHFRGRQNMTKAATWTDSEVATKVRMLMRDDLNHEGVICAARDRIAILSRDVHELTFALQTLLDTLPSREGQFMPHHMKVPLNIACRLIERLTGKPMDPVPPVPEEASDQEICDAMAAVHDMDTGLGDLARTISRKFEVYPRKAR